MADEGLQPRHAADVEGAGVFQLPPLGADNGDLGGEALRHRVEAGATAPGVHRRGKAGRRLLKALARAPGLQRLDHLVGVLGREEPRSEEHTSELQSLMRISYAVFCLKKKKYHNKN